ncbi:hypothetical protein JVU11DRAFT_8357 [Chiua virens]|nr:hypothetical protein JVU11DRAFT_8357 [Chiua virens]
MLMKLELSPPTLSNTMSLVQTTLKWRTNDSYIVGFNPTNTTPPFIQIFDSSFLDVTGSNATIRLVASRPGFAVAHEAPIYVPDLNVVFFSSNDGAPLGYSDWYNNSVVSMLNMTEVDNALAATTGDVNVQIQTLNLSDTVQMVNGGTGPYKGNLLFVTSGRCAFASFDNFYGRQFNSLNDIKVLPGTDIVFFTDPTYGWLYEFRPEPMLPSQVYRFDPSTGQIRVVADQFILPNGIAFTSDGRTAFVTDTGLNSGLWGYNQTYPATMQVFCIDLFPVTVPYFSPYSYHDSGIPDGIQLDTNGNVYSGFFLNSTSAEMIFTASGLLILDEERIYLANIQAQGIDLAAH